MLVMLYIRVNVVLLSGHDLRRRSDATMLMTMATVNGNGDGHVTYSKT